MAGLTKAELLHHPAYATVVWDLPPTLKGACNSASESGVKCRIAYEVHGVGPKKIVWLCGLGVIKWNWQRQTKDFGHDRATEYSSLVFDNRGMGESDKPWAKHTIKDFANDVVNLCDHLGWTEDRELHFVGASMGGMILQELGTMIPRRIASMTLASSGPRLINTLGFFENTKRQINALLFNLFFINPGFAKQLLLSDWYLASPDNSYTTNTEGPFYPTSGDRYMAEMLYLYLDPGFTVFHWILQALALISWSNSPQNLKDMADKVGRDRIQVVHGLDDRGFPLVHSEELIRGLGGFGEKGVKVTFVENCGHVIQTEQRGKFTELVNTFVNETRRLDVE